MRAAAAPRPTRCAHLLAAAAWAAAVGAVEVHPLSDAQYHTCLTQGSDPYGLVSAANGLCVQQHDCRKVRCDESLGDNIPAYSAVVRNVSDVQIALAFAQEHNLQVTVKTTGHNYAGSSMGKNSLMIWMHKFEKYNTIYTDSQWGDTCGTKYAHSIRVGGGQSWGEVYAEVADKFDIVGGGGLTVSAAGGWLQGCGLSALSRNRGLGVDNVLQFEVVLANGTFAVADKCSNPDLFWALRGGGGGTFGVVVAVQYRLHPISPVVRAQGTVEYHSSQIGEFGRGVAAWIDFWTDVSPTLDRRWGGYWTLNMHLLYFQGSMADARSTFLDRLESWKNGLPSDLQPLVKQSAEAFPSYWDERGRGASTDPGGHATLNIASRLVPREWLLTNGTQMKATLNWLAQNGFDTWNYILGGAVSDVAEDATAVHPAMRRAIWQIETLKAGQAGLNMIQKLRDDVPGSAAGLNHAHKAEPQWQTAFWGPQLARLEAIKERYDPEGRLNCYHCIGYDGEDPTSTLTRNTPGKYCTPGDSACWPKEGDWAQLAATWELQATAPWAAPPTSSPTGSPAAGGPPTWSPRALTPSPEGTAPLAPPKEAGGRLPASGAAAAVLGALALAG
eukprot:TRINITY_DN17559_c0_g1_i1.p1 TRINITY_DN17559_c0_g1~~TRINITY_DN17559_c0_g1_i1.p1  ORF type:complete len:641 (+),score=170.45 TRINITY_DN17559_c0_g1_i1:83-1924(+)